MTATVQERLSAIASGDRLVTEAERQAAERSIRDAVAVALAGQSQRSVEVVRRYVGETARDGPAAVWGTTRSTDPVSAALANGTAVQALEFDDVTPDCAAHLSSVLVPAMSALAGRMPPSRALDGFVHGLRGAAVAGALVSREAYRRGLQPTHTVGAIAAVCALGYAIGLPPSQTSAALGLVVGQAIGLRANTGTTSKAIQSGLAASAAARSVMLVMEGAAGGSASVDSLLQILGVDERRLAEVAGMSEVAPLYQAIKLYPTCGAAHSAAEVVLAARAELGGLGQPPTSVEVRVPPRMLDAMHFRWPDDPDQGRFSLHYVLATAWRNGAVEVDDFTDEAIQRASELGRPPWLRVLGDETYDPGGEQAEVVAEVAGRRVVHGVQHREGYPQRPLDPDQVEEKFDRCVVPLYGAARAKEIRQQLEGPEIFDRIGEVTAR